MGTTLRSKMIGKSLIPGIANGILMISLPDIMAIAMKDVLVIGKTKDMNGQMKMHGMLWQMACMEIIQVQDGIQKNSVIDW